MKELRSALTMVLDSDIAPLSKLADSIQSPHDWVRSRFRGITSETEEITGTFAALHEDGRLLGCAACLVLAVHWLSVQGAEPHWPIMEAAAKVLPPSDAQDRPLISTWPVIRTGGETGKGDDALFEYSSR